MRKIYLLSISLITSFGILTAQTLCNTGRYSTDTFTAVTASTSVVFGSAIKANGGVQSLTMNVYQPTGDAEVARPLIIWAHGGSFSFGTAADIDVTTLSQRFAKKGFVCASINYRLGISPLDSVGLVKAVLRAVQDMKASVRYFYKDKQTTDTYKIDTNNIFIGGSSAGAVTALHYAFLNRQCEVNQYLSTTAFNTLGGFDGLSGNSGYSTKVKGVINLCGALATYGWLEPGDMPFCSMHGTVDGTVNYNRAGALGLLVIDGSRLIKKQADLLGVDNPLYTWYGKDHVPYAGTSATNIAYMDTTVKFVRDYIISRMGCTDAALLPANTPVGTPTLYPYNTCAVNVNEVISFDVIGNIYPNPAENDITIEFSNSKSSHNIELVDVTGKIVMADTTEQSSYKIRKNHLSSGMYFIKVIDKSGGSTTRKVIFK
ncbi:MAG: T9SS type A sorting domain-containing protein [Bacteroidota bacterium]